LLDASVVASFSASILALLDALIITAFSSAFLTISLAAVDLTIVPARLATFLTSFPAAQFACVTASAIAALRIPSLTVLALSVSAGRISLAADLSSVGIRFAASVAALSSPFGAVSFPTCAASFLALGAAYDALRLLFRPHVAL
jgi:hypothetical protein